MGDGRCKDCRHWGEKQEPETTYVLEARGRGTTHRTVVTERHHRRCMKAVDASRMDSVANLPLDIAYVAVYEAYENELFTGPEFGCIHWEAKDA